MLVRARGAPSTAGAFIFAAGAIAGFCLIDQLLDLLSAETLGPTKPINRCQDRVLAGRVRLVAVGAALGAVSLFDDIYGWVPWLVGPLAATAHCLLIASVQLAAVAVGDR
ncbi:MAG TPA: hypothetical protein VFI54_05020 [Solirubrobacteraceae bacterium]|nr:hypothetical protein [Solirubrobacteraceae bacterium]